MEHGGETAKFACFVAHPGQTFLVIDCNGMAGYQSGQDLVIRLNSYSGTPTMGAFH